MKNIPPYSTKRSPVAAIESIPSISSSSSTTPTSVDQGVPRLRRPFAVWAAVALAGAAAMLVLALFLPVRVSLDDVGAELPPETPVTISLPHIGASVLEVAVTAASRDAYGALGPEVPVVVKLVPAKKRGIGLGLWQELQLVRQDGSTFLQYDQVYRVRLSVRALMFTLPMPASVVLTREYRVSTLTTPQLRMPDGVVQMNYQRPLELRWNSPIRDFSVETQPTIQTRSWVDPFQPDITHVDLEAAPSGTQYQVRVTGAVGINGAPLLSPVTITAETAAPPKPLPNSVRVEDGNRVIVQWDRPVKEVRYSIVPSVGSSLQIDEADPRVTYILLENPVHDRRHEITILGGIGTTGAPIASGTVLSFTTPPPLEVLRVSSAEGSYGVPLNSAITITFSEAIKDRKAAQAAVSFEPGLDGHFEWPAPDQLRFVPDGRLPDDTEIAVHIAAGPKGARGTDGGYLEEDLGFSFLTRPDKLIEVDLTHQTITLYEGDKVVYTGLVAAGVAGAPTPTGDFMVNYKLPSTRMKGVNPDGSHYDIPNVPWVMSFDGDYTLHGAPWRTRFGYPGSNGCVSMETSQAKMLFDWSPVGTPVSIHY